MVGCLEKWWNRQGVRLQYLAAATTLETCLQHPFTQPIANKLVHPKQQKNEIVLRPLRAIASHELLHDSKQLLQRHPLRNPPLLRTPMVGALLLLDFSLLYKKLTRSSNRKIHQNVLLESPYIYMLWSQYFGQVWPFSKSIFWPSQSQYFGQGHFRTIKIGVSGDFFLLSYHCVCFFCSQLSGNFLKIAFFKKRVQKLGFSVFCVLSLNFENSLFLGLPKHYKNRGFS